MTLTRRDGSPAPTHLKMTVHKEWLYDVTEAALSLAEFTDQFPIYYEDVFEMIHDYWVPEDIQEPPDFIPPLHEVYVLDDTDKAKIRFVTQSRDKPSEVFTD